MRVNPLPAFCPICSKSMVLRTTGSTRVIGLPVFRSRMIIHCLCGWMSHTPFLAALGMYQAKIVPREEVSRQGGAFGRNPIGSGPFQFTSWEGNQRIRLRKYAGYHGGTPYLEEIQFLIYPGGRIDDVLSDFRQGKLEGMPVYWQFREKLMENRQLRWVHRPSLSLLFYGMNCQHPALKNPELRRPWRRLPIGRKSLPKSIRGSSSRPPPCCRRVCPAINHRTANGAMIWNWRPSWSKRRSKPEKSRRRRSRSSPTANPPGSGRVESSA